MRDGEIKSLCLCACPLPNFLMTRQGRALLSSPWHTLGFISGPPAVCTRSYLLLHIHVLVIREFLQQLTPKLLQQLTEFNSKWELRTSQYPFPPESHITLKKVVLFHAWLKANIEFIH